MTAAASARSASCASTRSRCCRSAATTWPITGPIGWRSVAGRVPGCAHLPGQLVPQERRGQVHVARLRRQQPRHRVDLRALLGRGRRGRNPNRIDARARRARHSGLEGRCGGLDALFAVDPAAWTQEAAAIEEHYARFGSRLPAELAARLEQMKKAIAGRLTAAETRSSPGSDCRPRPVVFAERSAYCIR